MKSNRMRYLRPAGGRSKGPTLPWLLSPTHAAERVKLSKMPAPNPVSRLHPDQVIEDILVSTLVRVQKTANPELAAAAARYIALLREKAI